jgi:serine/threonine protein kinase
MGEIAKGSAKKDRYFAGYLLRKLLGRGGMAEVFLAEKTGPGGVKKEVALKRILPQYADDPDRIMRFLEEMKLAVALEHRNVVHVNDFGEADGTYYLDLELVRGTDAASLCAKLAERTNSEAPRYRGQERGVLPPNIVAWIGMQVAEGLSYAHQQKRYVGDETGVLHRDISPDNCMVDLWGEVKINDWGIAKALKGEMNIVSSTGHAYGKLLYAPPEQLKGQEIDARADLYALGVSLFELLTGRHPYEDPMHPHEDPMAKAARVFQSARAPIAQLAPEAPAAMQEILENLIRADRDQRAPRSAAELVRPLKDLAGDLHDVQKQLGQLVALVYDQGPPTVAEMPGYRPDVDDAAPSHSAKRPIQRATPDASHAVHTTPLMNGDDDVIAAAPLSTQPVGAAHEIESNRASTRSTLLVVMGFAAVIVLGLLAGTATFYFVPIGDAPNAVESASPASTELRVEVGAQPHASESAQPPAAPVPPDEIDPPTPAIPAHVGIEATQNDSQALLEQPRSVEPRESRRRVERARPMVVPQPAPLPGGPAPSRARSESRATSGDFGL